MSFRNYIARRRVTDTPEGDFVADAKLDVGMPDARTWGELETYLRSRRADPAAVAAVRPVWRGYLAARRRAALQH